MNCPSIICNSCNPCCSSSCTCSTTTSTTSTTTVHIPCDVDNCEETIDVQCIQYNNGTVECLSIENGNSLQDVLAILFEKVTGYNCTCEFCGAIVEKVQFTTTTTTTLLCDPCENTILDIANNAGDVITDIKINGITISLDGGSVFPIGVTNVFATVPSGTVDIEITVIAGGLPTAVTIFDLDDVDCQYTYCFPVLAGTNTYTYNDVPLRCLAYIRTGIGSCSQGLSLYEELLNNN